jgi:ferredoxin
MKSWPRSVNCAGRREAERRGDLPVALIITDACTACDACVEVCPNEAITAGDPIYRIDPLHCTECVGAKDEPQCQLVCPAECIEADPDWRESREQLEMKYAQLHS